MPRIGEGAEILFSAIRRPTKAASHTPVVSATVSANLKPQSSEIPFKEMDSLD